MSEIEITIHNRIDVTVQAQVFNGRALVCSEVVAPGESCTLSAELTRYDIYLKNAITGWGICHKLNCEAESVTAMKHKGRYTLVGE